MWSHFCECIVCAAPKLLLHTARAAEKILLIGLDRRIMHWAGRENQLPFSFLVSLVILFEYVRAQSITVK